MMSVTLEKVFLHYILQNKRYFAIVEPYYFKNNEISFIYKVIREYISKSSEAETPTTRQIWEMVSLEDKEGIITKEIFKSVMKSDNQEYDEMNFIIPKMNSWILINKLRTGTTDIIDETRNLEHITDFEQAQEAANKIKSIIDSSTATNYFDTDDLGSDFDEPENHYQDSAKFKVRCGFETIDHMLGGGWDRDTLNLIMAPTNAGKSIWMQNFTVKAADMGYNVLYITLEMSERKVMKRLGSMRLKIPINEYDTKSKDQDFIKKRIESLKSGGGHSDLFENKQGKIYVKFWAAGTANISHFDNYIQKLRDNKGIKIDLIVIDYLTLMAPLKGVATDNLYLKGKHLAEAVRAMAAKYSCPIISAIQVAKDAWGANDITLESIPESKAIAETVDTLFGIIRSEEMRRNNIYRFKLLKQRDGDFSRSQVKVDLNPNYLTLENDIFLDV